MTTLVGLLGSVADPAQPFLTFYDCAAGERIELSSVTTANWVAKTSNFMVDGLDIEPGTRLRLGLPSHWESFVWILSAWNVGATLVDERASIAVVGPDLAAEEDVRVALSLKPLGMRFDSPPPGFVDYNAEVLGHGDHFQSFDPPTDDTEALDLDGTARSHAEVFASTDADSRRLLLEPGSLTRDITTLVAVAKGGGSLVIVTHANSVQRDRISVDERAHVL